MNFRSGLLLLLLGSVLLPQVAAAQNSPQRHPWLEDDFQVSVGAFLPRKEVKIRVDGQTPGAEIDFDEGVDTTADETTGNLNIRWNFGEKWSAAGQYFTTSDSGQATLSKDITWDDVIYRAGTRVGAGVDVTVARLFFGRTFSVGHNYEFGLGAGLHWLEIGAFLEGEIYIGDETTGFRRQSASAHAPLPNIGGWYWYALSPRWLVFSRLDWFGASIGDYSGNLWNANAGINFQPWEHVGFGLSYQYFQVDVDVNKSDWNGALKLSYDGPFVSLSVNW